MTGDRRSRPVAALVRRPLGVALVSWRYFWRTTPIHRSDVAGDRSDLPPPAPADRDLQHPDDGYGTLLHRHYAVRIRGSSLGPEELLDRLAADPDRWSPEFAVLRRTRGDDGADLRFTIESWARPGDRLSHLLYNRLRVAKEVQLNRWTHACIRAARLAGGRPHGGVTVHTRRLENRVRQPEARV